MTRVLINEKSPATAGCGSAITAVCPLLDDAAAAAELMPCVPMFTRRRLMHGRWQADPDAALIREFLRLLAVCHTVIPEGPPTPAEIKYQVHCT